MAYLFDVCSTCPDGGELLVSKFPCLFPTRKHGPFVMPLHLWEMRSARSAPPESQDQPASSRHLTSVLRISTSNVIQLDDIRGRPPNASNVQAGARVSAATLRSTTQHLPNIQRHPANSIPFLVAAFAS